MLVFNSVYLACEVRSGAGESDPNSCGPLSGVNVGRSPRVNNGKEPIGPLSAAAIAYSLRRCSGPAAHHLPNVAQFLSLRRRYGSSALLTLRSL